MKNKIIKWLWVYYNTPIILFVLNIIYLIIFRFIYTMNIGIIYELYISIMLIMSIINFILIISLGNKKKYIIHIIIQILEILFLNVISSFIISIIILNNQNKALLEITNIKYLNFKNIFIDIFLIGLIINYILILSLNIKKSLRINKGIYILLFPLKNIMLLILYLFSLSWGNLCPWDPLINTKYSTTFNIYNINRIEEGMTKEYVNLIIGEPLYNYMDENGIMCLKYTKGGKCKFDDFAWFHFELEFKDNTLVKKMSWWEYD